jgi:hypothetical protein
MRASLFCLPHQSRRYRRASHQLRTRSKLPHPRRKSQIQSNAEAPEIILFNGVIYTGAGFAEDKPETVQAMAIGGGKVIAVGSDKEIKHLAGPENGAPRSEHRRAPARSSFPDSTMRTHIWAARDKRSSTSISPALGRSTRCWQR